MEITLLSMIKHWIENDSVLKQHFHAGSNHAGQTEFHNEVYCSCDHPNSKTFRTGNEKRVARLEHNIVVICEGPHIVCKFQIAHPMFFQKMRGWIYDMHNRLGMSCDEYLR